LDQLPSRKVIPNRKRWFHLRNDRKRFPMNEKGHHARIAWRFLELGMILLLWVPRAPIFAQEFVAPPVKKSESSIVVIRSYDGEGRTLHQNSGFYINRGGDVITRLFPIKGVKKADVRSNDGMLYPVKEVVSEDRDINLIRVSVKIPARLVHPLPISFSPPHLSELVAAIGGPPGVGKTVAYGIVSALREVVGFGKMIEVTPSLPSAMDGSPVVNMKGNMIGAAIIRMVDGQKLHFIISGESLIKLLPTGVGTPLSEWEADRAERAEESYARGLPLLWRGDYERALPYFLEAVKKDPRDTKAQFLIGYCNAQLGLLEEAANAYEKSILLNPDFVMAHLLLGLTYVELRDKKAALKEYNALKKLHSAYAKNLLDMIR
jgi:hypothetical protein